MESKHFILTADSGQETIAVIKLDGNVDASTFNTDLVVKIEKAVQDHYCEPYTVMNIYPKQNREFEVQHEVTLASISDGTYRFKVQLTETVVY